MRRSYLVLALAASLAAVSAVAALRFARPTTLMAELADATPERPFAARLSIETKYRPCNPLPTTPDSTVTREVCGTAAEGGVDPHTFAATAETFDPDSLQASALAGVIWWDEKEVSLDKAVAGLSRAHQLSGDSVPVLVNLSAVHLVRAERTQNPHDLMLALEYAGVALSYQPGNLAALFNTALALDALEIEEQAAHAWDRYIAADSASEWTAEARRRRRALDGVLKTTVPPSAIADAQVERFAGRHPQEARLIAWNSILGAWGEAIEKGDSAGAAQRLAVAERTGRTLEARGGDVSLADAVRAIKAVAGDREMTEILARAHRQFAAGNTLYDKGEHGAAADSFARVLRANPPSPALVRSAEMFTAGALVYARKLDRADSAFKAILSTLDTTRHPALAARTRWMMGSRLLKSAQYPGADEQYRAAYGTFERIGESEHAGIIAAMESETAYLRGDEAAGYAFMHRALHSLRGHRDSKYLQGQLMVLADWAAQAGMRWAAEPIQNECVAVAIRSGSPLTAAEALLARANVRVGAGDITGARLDVDSASRFLEAFEDADARASATARLRMARGLIQPEAHGGRALAQLDSAVAYFAKAPDTWWLLRSLMVRAEMRIKTGDATGAAADLDTLTIRIRGLSGVERDAPRRAAVMEQARGRFDQLVMLHVRSARPVEALRALERGRVSLDPVNAARPGSGAIQARPGEVAVEYALIGDTLLVWTVRGDSVQLHEGMVNRREFLRTAAQVSAWLEAPAGADRARPGLQRMYDWLVRPVRERLGARETPLVILADGEIAGVPFTALLDSVSGRYLVQDHRIRTTATLADAARPATEGATGRALLVADPAFDPSAHPALDRLRGARGEAQDLRGIYPDHVLLEGAAATRDALLHGARSARVIHYAGHAVFNDARPERSFLVLAGADSVGRLTAEHVGALRLGGVRLVVLSACQTLPSREGRSGGFAGLSGALLAAGAEGVVGSLWRVDDRRTRSLMLAFHREYQHSGDPAAALRQAQLQMLGSADPDLKSPSTWAGFRYAGR